MFEQTRGSVKAALARLELPPNIQLAVRAIANLALRTTPAKNDRPRLASSFPLVLTLDACHPE